jgi:hypothetical protein
MVSPRLPGPAERMGLIAPELTLPQGSWDTFESNRHQVVESIGAIPVGRVALSAGEFSLPDPLTTAASFVGQEGLSLGRNEGRHQPRFGQMLLNGPGVHERPILVAVKPFTFEEDTNPDALIATEIAASSYLNSLNDRQLAYLPLGVWKNADGINHLLTLYEHDVTSYDNTFWVDREVNPEALRATNVTEALIQCGRSLGYLHGAGLIHRDAEAKNLASNLKGIRFIDLEGARMLPRGSADEADALTAADIEGFLQSTLQVDENREAIEPVLSMARTAKLLAQQYNAGRREAAQDSGVHVAFNERKNERYFRSVISDMLERIHRS